MLLVTTITQNHQHEHQQRKNVYKMAILIYGVQKTAIGIDEVLEKCPSCESDTFCDLFLTSDYYHMFYIPIFPIGKEVSIFCKKCGLKRYNVPLTVQTMKNYQELNSKFRHPWYTYSVPIVFGSLILIAIIVSVF